MQNGNWFLFKISFYLPQMIEKIYYHLHHIDFYLTADLTL